VLDAVEVGSNSVDTGWIANEDNLVSQKFGLQVKVETRAVTIDDELGFGKCSFCHSIIC
jgi:hypothetical protein